MLARVSKKKSKFTKNIKMSKFVKEHKKCQNLQRNEWQFGRCPTGRPDAIHFFANFDVFKSLYLSEN